MMSEHENYSRLRWGVLSISLLAWLVLLAAPTPVSLCGPGIAGGDWNPLRMADWVAFAKSWGLMLVAMMGPMLTAPLYFVYVSSFARMRVRLMGLCALGYGAAWVAVAAILATGEVAAKARFPGSWWPALLVGGAALIWQASPWKKACLNRCHRHRPVRAFGLAAHGDAFRVGLDHGFWCVGSCWLNMLWPMLLPSGHLVGMMAVAVLAYAERLDPGAVPAWRLRGFRAACFYLGWIWRAQKRPTVAAP